MKSNFNKYPSVQLRETADECVLGWEQITQKLQLKIQEKNLDKSILVIDCYQGIHEDEILHSLVKYLNPDHVFCSADALLTEQEIRDLTQNDVTDDRIFGYLSRLTLDQFFDTEKTSLIKNQIREIESGSILIFGIGASLLSEHTDLLVFADMARWEIQLRMRRDEVNNLGLQNKNESIEKQYKRGYFVDWRVCDRHKKSLIKNWDYVFDTNKAGEPKMLAGRLVNEGIAIAARQPFSPVPYFDAGPWGGQWMKEICGLDKDQENFAWCFNCVPEENSVLLQLGDVKFELPSINVVFSQPTALLGEAVYGRFGDEFPIRFDFLDTIDGGNLSLQVHPTTEYIQEKFGIHYTQDESYYLLDAKGDTVVYLGLKEDIDSQKMMADLRESQSEGTKFPDEKHIEKWPAKKHDHFLIPAGTVHCSGSNGMVLEISSTPYIFTFKLWDWGRLGMDGKPRPINIEHGENVIDWSRTMNWTAENLVNQVIKLESGEGWRSEKTGLHEREFIETRRHWFSESVMHESVNSVQVYNVIEGREIIVESADNRFKPMVFHYAETFIVPAASGDIIITPHGESVGCECGTIKAYVRT